MRPNPAVIFIIAVLVVIPGFCIPSVSAAIPYDGRQTGPIVTSPDLNMTGVNISNHSIPSRYPARPERGDGNRPPVDRIYRRADSTGNTGCRDHRHGSRGMVFCKTETGRN